MPDLSHELWEWAGALLIGGAAAAAIVLAWWQITKYARHCDEMARWGRVWHAEAKSQEARALAAEERADGAEAREAELKRQLVAAAQRRQLDGVLNAYRLTDTGWERAS